MIVQEIFQAILTGDWSRIAFTVKILVLVVAALALAVLSCFTVDAIAWGGRFVFRLPPRPVDEEGKPKKRDDSNPISVLQFWLAIIIILHTVYYGFTDSFGTVMLWAAEAAFLVLAVLLAARWKISI